jgi:isoquinoline 1-oxidoreductase beta subunit
MSKNKWKISRRGFLVKFGIGAGVLVGVTMAGCPPMRRFLATTANELEPSYANADGPEVWFELTPANKVIVRSPKVEMGQGIFTGFAMIVAEELDVDLEQVEVIHADTERGPVDPISTGGSLSTMGLWPVLRELSANLKYMIRENAASIMGVPLGQLTTAKGVVSGGGKSMTYGEVAAQATNWETPKKAPALKAREDFRIIGTEVPRVDLKPKVMGEAIFGMDATLPDMLYGAVVRPDRIDVSYEGADTRAAEGMPGVVKVVKEKDFVGVVATSKMAADMAKQAIKVNWKANKVWQQAEIEEMIKVGKGKAVEIQREGKAKSILEGEEVIVAEFSTPIGAHAQLEPNGALASYEDGKVTIYMSTQVAKITANETADRLGIKYEDVKLVPTYLGGGFGRRLHTPNAVQAALLSKAVGKPVHCFFDRKEEFQNDTFRPPTHHVMKAKVKEDGMIEAIEHNVSSGAVAFSPDGSVILPVSAGMAKTMFGADLGAWRGGMIQYSGIPNYRAVSWLVDLPFATSWWRSLGLLANTFAIESFMDELALKADQDPIDFRLAQIEDNPRGKRLKGVIEAVKEKSAWGKAMPEGSAMGFACSTDANTPVAQVVEVSVANKMIKVHKVTCAIDPGFAVNPDGIRAQCEGAIIMGLSASLFEKMEIKDGSVVPTLYGPYKMALMRHAPKEIEVVIVESGDNLSGVGEPPLGPIGAAIANAVFRITGQRLRDMPLELG